MPTFADASGHSHSGAIVPAVGTQTGPLVSVGIAPPAALFRGLGKINVSATLAAIPLNPPYSVEYWGTLVPSVTSWQDPLGWNATEGNALWTLDFHADGAFGQDLEVYGGYPMQYAYLDEIDGTPGQGPTQDGGWHYVVVTHEAGADASSYVFYVDAVPLGPVFVGGSPATQGGAEGYLALGDGPTPSGWGEPYFGALAHVAIYDRALSADEVLAHYNAAGYYVFNGSVPLAGQPGRDRSQRLGSGAAPYAAVILSDSPLAYWPLDDTGRTARDLTGHGYTALLPDGGVQTGYSPGPVQGSAALSFDGSAALIIPQLSGFPTSGPFTIEGWVHPALDRAPRYTILSWGAPDLFVELAQRDSTALEIILYGWGTASSFSGVYAYPLGDSGISDPSWHYVAVTLDGGGTTVLYWDGQPQTSFVGGDPLPSLSVLGAFIGGNCNGGGRWLGELGQVALYSSALSADRILAHYQATANPDPARLATTGQRGRAREHTF